MAGIYATVKSLGDLIDKVSKIRETWGLPKHKELWFRGESRDYKDTILRPELYRPIDEKVPLKQISKLLSIENELHEEFMRNATEYQGPTDDNWGWDSYFLMQHHDGPTRLLDWSDGALMAVHFALRNKMDDSEDARVYVLEPYRLAERIKQTPDRTVAEETWKKYLEMHPSGDLDGDDWDEIYLPCFEKEREEMTLPRPPLVLDFVHLTRRIAAQRGRFILFGSEPAWLADELNKTDSTIRLITIPKEFRPYIRQQLRDCGVTESVIYPDMDGIGREMRQLWDDRREASEENA